MKRRSFSMLVIERIFGEPSGLYGHVGDKETVVSAAYKVGDDVFLGDDHNEALEKAVDEGYGIYSGERGFYTSSGRFLSREEAMILAKKNRQVDVGRSRQRELDSNYLKQEA
jgi:hypothetical protein